MIVEIAACVTLLASTGLLLRALWRIRAVDPGFRAENVLTLRTVLPMLGNIVVSMFKQTALLSTITVLELLASGMAIGQMTYRFVEPLTMVGVFYFAVSYVSARALRTLEVSDEVRA